MKIRYNSGDVVQPSVVTDRHGVKVKKKLGNYIVNKHSSWPKVQSGCQLLSHRLRMMRVGRRLKKFALTDPTLKIFYRRRLRKLFQYYAAYNFILRFWTFVYCLPLDLLYCGVEDVYRLCMNSALFTIRSM